MSKDLLKILYAENRTRKSDYKKFEIDTPFLQMDLLIIRSRKIYVLNVIEARSRYLWSAIQKTKTWKETADNLIQIIKMIKEHIPDIRYIYSDDGNEFKGKLPEMLEKEGMVLKRMNKRKEDTHSLALIERVNKTLINNLLLEIENSDKSLSEIILDLVSDYNNRVHSTTNKTPQEVFEDGEEPETSEDDQFAGTYEPNDYVLRLIRPDERIKSEFHKRLMVWYPIPYQVLSTNPKNNHHELLDLSTNKVYELKPRRYQLKRITSKEAKKLLNNKDKLMKIFEKENKELVENKTKRRKATIKGGGNALPINNIDDFFQDIEGINLYDNVPQTPFRLVVSSSSGAGKTNIVLNLLKDYLYYDYLILCYKNVNEPKYQFFRDFIEAVNRRILESHEQYSREYNVHIEIVSSDPAQFGLKSPIQLYVYHELEHLPHLKYFEQDKKLRMLQKIIVIDDFQNEKDQDVVKDYFIYSRKLNFSCIYISQTFHKTPQVVRSNASDIILLKHPKREISTLAQTLGNHLSNEQFKELMKRATSKKYGFLYIRTAAEADDMFRIGFSDPVKIEEDSDGEIDWNTEDEDRIDNDFESSEEI